MCVAVVQPVENISAKACSVYRSDGIEVREAVENCYKGVLLGVSDDTRSDTQCICMALGAPKKDKIALEETGDYV
jgi:hypothetical protein